MKTKYPLDKELKNLTLVSLFPNIHVYPFVNVFMGMIPCRSDAKVEVKKHIISGYEGYKLPTRIIEPRNNNEKLPCIMFFHGGGLMLKAAGVHYQFAKWYAEKARCRVIMPDYRLMPKYRFPYAVEDCYCAYEWAIAHARSLNIDENRIIFVGDSAGGTIASAIVFMARDRGQILPFGVLMSYPALDRRMNTQSMKKYMDTPVLDAGLTKMYWDEMLINGLPQHIEYASPMEAESFSGFPTTYIEVAEFDSLHDDGILFAEKLKSANIPVELHEVEGTCHGFEVALWSRIVRESLERRLRWLKETLAHDVDTLVNKK